jgi:hypothetical protein
MARVTTSMIKRTAGGKTTDRGKRIYRPDVLRLFGRGIKIL